MHDKLSQALVFPCTHVHSKDSEGTFSGVQNNESGNVLVSASGINRNSTVNFCNYTQEAVSGSDFLVHYKGKKKYFFAVAQYYLSRNVVGWQVA